MARLTFRVWLRNLLPFTLLSALLSSVLALSLLLDEHGIGSAQLIFLPDEGYVLLVLRGLTALLTPMITARIVQSLDGVDLTLVRSIRLSGRGILTMLLIFALGLLFSFLPIVGIIVSLCLVYFGFVAIPAAVTERLNPWAALQRSTSLIVRRYLTTIPLVLASVIVGAIPYWVTYVLVATRIDLTPQPLGNMADTIGRLQQLRPYAIGCVAVTSLLLPFQGILRAVCYVLLRRDSTSAEQELSQVFE